MLTAKVQYALVLLQEISLNESGRPVKIKQIAQKNQLDEKFLQQVARLLRMHEVIRSVRGPGGGCVALKDLSSLSLLEVMDAVDSAKQLKNAVPSEDAAKISQALHAEVMTKLNEIKALK
jgi:Rrf2 family iron-sulfur cluster assembly transcriptional regulator